MSPVRRQNDGRRFSMLDPRVMDPDQEIVDRSSMTPDEVDETVAVLEAMGRWRDAERELSEAAARYMHLGDTDMRALRFLLATERHGDIPTPGAIAAHLRISAAATTKLLDRLAAQGHITRTPHPDDRRSTAVRVADETRRSARASVGRSHARRFDAVAALTSDERRAVLRFFDALIDSASWPEDAAGAGAGAGAGATSGH